MPISKTYVNTNEVFKAVRDANLAVKGSEGTAEYFRTGKSFDDLANFFNGNEKLKNAILDAKKFIELGETLQNEQKTVEEKSIAYAEYIQLLEKFSSVRENPDSYLGDIGNYMVENPLDIVNTPEVKAAYEIIHTLNQQSANFKLIGKRNELYQFLQAKNAFLNIKENELKIESDKIIKELMKKPDFADNYEQEKENLNHEISEAEAQKQDANIEKVYNEKIAVFDVAFDDPKTTDSKEMKEREKELAEEKERLTLEFNKYNEEVKAKWDDFNEKLSAYNKEIDEVAKKNENIRIKTEEHNTIIRETEAKIEQLGKDAEPIRKEILEMEENLKKMDKVFEDYLKQFNEFDGLKRRASLDQPNENDLETITLFEEHKDFIYNEFLGAMVKEFPNGDPKNVLYDALHIKDQMKLEQENNKLLSKLNEQKANMARKGKKPEENASYMKDLAKQQHVARALSLRSMIDSYQMGENADLVANVLTPLLGINQKVNAFDQLNQNLTQAQEKINQAKERNPHFWKAKKLEGEFEKYTAEKMVDMKTKKDAYEAQINEKINALNNLTNQKEQAQNSILQENERFVKLNLGEEDKMVRIPPVPPQEKPLEAQVLNDRISKAEKDINEKFAPRIQKEKEDRHKEIKNQVKQDIEKEADQKINTCKAKIAENDELLKRVEAIFNQAKENSEYMTQTFHEAKKEADKPSTEIFQTIKDQLDYYKEHAMDVFKDGHNNTREYRKMAEALSEASNAVDDLLDDIRGKTPEEARRKIELAKDGIKDKLTELGNKSDQYLSEKKKGVHWIPSKMRFFRIDMAQAMKNFSENALGCIEKDSMFKELPGGEYVEKLTAKPLVPKGMKVKDFCKLLQNGATEMKLDKMAKTMDKVFLKTEKAPEKEPLQLENLAKSAVLQSK